MSKASKSMLGCGVYLVVIGILVLVFPEFVLAGIGVFTTPDIMSRMTGMIFLIFAYIYIRTGLKDKGMEFFYLISAQERCSIPFFLITFYLLGYANWVLVFFSFIDSGLGVWTLIALRLDRRSKES